MKVVIALVALFATLALPRSAPTPSQDRALIVRAGEHIAGNIATIADDIRVDGEVDGDVTSWSGNILIDGRVGGDVISYGGRVTLSAEARVGGHILALSGGLQRASGAVVAGQMLGSPTQVGALASLFDLFMPSPADAAANDTVGRALFGIALGVFVLAFCLLCCALWPGRTEVTSVVLRRLPLRALALGLLTTFILALALLPLVALLAATLIGLPLCVVALLLVQAPYIYGLAALARAGGAWLAHGRSAASAATDGGVAHALPPGDPVEQATGLGPATLIVAAALALLVALAAVAAPLWGLALFYLVASPGVGAAILSRGGLAVPAA